MNYRTFSLMHLLTVSSLGAAVPPLYDDREGHPRGRSRRRQRRASSRPDRRLLWYEIEPPYRTLYLGCDQAPPEAICTRGFKANRPCVISEETEAAAMVGEIGQPAKAVQRS